MTVTLGKVASAKAKSDETLVAARDQRLVQLDEWDI
jgi:hypothetical protein